VGILAGTAAAAVAAIVLILLALAPWESDGDGSVTEFVTPTPRPTAIPSQGSTLGSPDAPLTIVEYSDFLCPYCKQAALETVPQIEEEYIATGKVKLVFKHFVIHGKEAEIAAGAAECASEQNAFWQYHDVLFLNNERVTFNSENLKRFAQGLGLDTQSFSTCLDSERYMDKLAADADEARRRGVSSTPTFFVGQTKIEGAKSYAEFKKAIDDELARLGGTPAAE
jgi:protein-disulfide isomerase